MVPFLKKSQAPTKIIVITLCIIVGMLLIAIILKFKNALIPK